MISKRPAEGHQTKRVIVSKGLSDQWLPLESGLGLSQEQRQFRERNNG
jgi:hypothetical protein